MTTYVQDSFTGADGTLINAHTSDSGGAWVLLDTISQGPSSIVISGNKMRRAAYPVGDYGGEAYVYSSASTPTGTDYDIEFAVSFTRVAAGGYDAAVTLYEHGDIAGPAKALFELTNQNTLSAQLHLFPGGGVSDQNISFPITANTEYALVLQVRGATCTLLIDGVSKGTFTRPAAVSGPFAFNLWDSSGESVIGIDDFRVVDATITSTTGGGMLTKDTSTVLVSSGSAGTPGVVGHDAYYETVTTYQQRFYTRWVWVPYDPVTGEPAHYESFTTSDGKLYPVTTLVYHPAVASVAPVPAVPPTYDTDYHLGWNAGARSVAEITADGIAQWSVDQATIGAVVGFNTVDASTSYAEIQHGFYFNHGVVSVIESGVAKTAPIPFVSADVFAVRRSGSVVRYYINDALAYTSSVPSYGTVFLDASLYSGGDAIVGAMISDTVADTVASSGIGAASMLPLASFGGIALAQAGVALQPLTGAATGAQNQGATVSLSPLVSTGADHAYASSEVALAALTTGITAGALVPTIAVSANGLEPAATSATGLTGEISLHTGVMALAPFTTLGADRSYGTASVSLAPLATTIIENRGWITGYAELAVSGSFAVSASGTEQPANEFGYTMGFSLSGYGGAAAKLNMPAGQFVATGVGTVVGRARLAMPAPSFLSSGYGGGIATAQLGLSTGFKVQAFAGAVASVTLHDGFTLDAVGSAGTIGRARLKMPLFELTAAAELENFGGASLTMPALQPVASGLAELFGPSWIVEAAGYAEVVPVYEAYAMNMLHPVAENIGVEQVNEVTHYTNYPFTQIVRYNGNYYGVGADGLYQLGGDTDTGNPISWSFRTCLSDLGNKQKKRWRSMYMGGRLADTASVTLVVGEAQDETYTYTNVRGSTAQNYRQMFGRGVKARYCALELSDTSGSFVEVDSLDIEHEVLERAI